MRDLGTALIGLVVYFTLRWAGLAVAWNGWGPELAFEPGSARTSAAWLLLSLALAVGAAFVGAWVAGSLGSGKSVQYVAGLLLILGVASFLADARRQRVEPPEDLGSLSVQEALVVARRPGWLAVIEPLAATAGALVGGAGRRRR